jgi:hypothetical protein
MAENPIAGVSGPGAYSKRTDIGTPEMKMGSIAYGEGVETQAIKSGAPLAKSEGAKPEPVTELFAPTGRPNEPITAGIDRGAGPGSSALQMNKVTVKLSDSLAAMLPFDTTGEIAVLYQEALARGN